MNKLMNKLINKLCYWREEWDCDGVTLTLRDKLTDGRIFYYCFWDFSRVGSSIGESLYLFDRKVKNFSRYEH